uniref:Uncharacterized protein n=1 Tax=Anguilla anguilla TaxID=7936 RepID=A0A0E9SHJ8_ANGAN
MEKSALKHTSYFSPPKNTEGTSSSRFSHTPLCVLPSLERTWSHDRFTSAPATRSRQNTSIRLGTQNRGINLN